MKKNENHIWIIFYGDYLLVENEIVSNVGNSLMNGYNLVDEELRDFFANYRNRLLPIMVIKNRQVSEKCCEKFKINGG